MTPPKDDNPNASEEIRDSRRSHEPGEFTRAFGKIDKESSTDSSAEGSDPGSLTQFLGIPNPPPRSGSDQPSPPSSKPPASANSFTNAFEGSRAFTHDLADLGEDRFKTEISIPPRSNAPSKSPGSFTRLFSSGEDSGQGILTPTGFEQDRPQRPPAAVKPPAEAAPGNFTEAFRAPKQSSPSEQEPKVSSFTEEFGRPTPRTSDPYRSSESSRSYSPEQSEPTVYGDPPRSRAPKPPIASEGGFTRLIDSSRFGETSPQPRFDPSADAGAGEKSSAHDATVVFRSGSASETEFSAPPGRSEYTQVINPSKIRQAAAPHDVGASPSLTNPPAPGMQYPPAPHIPQAPAWQPAPSPQWPPQHMAPPPLMQPPVPSPLLAAGPPSLGEKLVAFLPLILTISVVNFLGLLAVLIILFATRR